MNDQDKDKILYLQDLEQQNDPSEIVQIIKAKIADGQKIQIMAQKQVSSISGQSNYQNILQDCLSSQSNIPELSAQKPFLLENYNLITNLNSNSKREINSKRELNSRRELLKNSNYIYSMSLKSNQDLKNEEEVKSSQKKDKSTQQIFQGDFSQTLRNIDEFQILQDGIKAYEEGKLSFAKQLLKNAYLSSVTLLIGAKNNLLKSKQLNVLCIQCLAYLSLIDRTLGQVETAIQYLVRLLNTFTIFDNEILAKIYLDLAQMFLYQNQWQNSYFYYFEALILYEKTNQKPLIAYCLTRLAYISAVLMNKIEAKKLIFEGISLYKSCLEADDYRLGEAYFTLGHIYFVFKELDFCKEILLLSVDILKKRQFTHSQPDYRFIKTYNLLGIVLAQLNETNDAIISFKLSLKCFNGNISIDKSLVLNNLSLALCGKQKFVKAQKYITEALKIFEQLNLTDHPRYTRLQNNYKLISGRF